MIKKISKLVTVLVLCMLMSNITTRAEASEERPQRHGQNLEILSRVPELTAPRASLQTNDALKTFLLEFIDTYIADMQREDQGRPRGGMNAESWRFSGYFMQGYRQAMGADTASRALGLNDYGMDVFYGSKIIDFFTATSPNELLGTFNIDARLVSVAINTIHNGMLSGLDPDHIARVIFYEIDGRGRGWEPTLIFALTEYFGLGNPYKHGGLYWDPTMEIRVSEAAGGIHTLFEAADNGQEAVRDFMNANLRKANPYFDFDYDSWQMARTVDHIIRHQWDTDNGRIAGRAFRNMGGVNIHRLQSSVDVASNPAITMEVRRENATRVNRYVAILADIGTSLENVNQVQLATCDRLPLIDLNNPSRGIVAW